jgi:hypothetical protein
MWLPIMPIVRQLSSGTEPESPRAYSRPFLDGLRRTLGCASGLLMFSESIVLIDFSFDRFAVVTFITRVARRSKSIVRGSRAPRRESFERKEGKLAGWGPFLLSRQNAVRVIHG